ncbi:helix-turn-helix domain-containing protein [Cohnella zeiphila]|uniref:Helix-turn-helix domain-containing protein n=1 Tax=Cohnella zeiphila TaxID=2761120 RepID=A0A7X0SUQ5_9BACL|nr:helix-turn-helix domain-containing protein [Cohnella zeiphila]MBB6735494.1 helix-turn-helix domain-containing protein [Cohnella zeiphila]
MSDLGLLLRKAREQKGYSLDDVQEATKIRKRYLEAIEQGDYKVLPGSFYVRAFVKTYAETVGLDAEEVLRLYHKELPRPATPETVTQEAMIKPRSRSVQHSDRWGKLVVNLVLWMFVVLIVVVIYIYFEKNTGSKAKQSDQDTQITNETATPSVTPSSSPSASVTPPPVESSTPPPATVTLTVTKTSGNTTTYDLSPAGTHELQIVSPNSWVGVKQDSSSGKYLINKTPSDETPIVVQIDGPFYVNIAHAKTATITIDGTPVDDGDVSGSKKFQFNPTDGSSPTP